MLNLIQGFMADKICCLSKPGELLLHMHTASKIRLFTCINTERFIKHRCLHYTKICLLRRLIYDKLSHNLTKNYKTYIEIYLELVEK